MTNSRQKILNYIIEEQSATAEELSRVFKVTPANIRHHLSILVEQGSLTIIGEKANKGKGRPKQIYSAAQQGNRNNLDQLSDSLLCALCGDSPTEESQPLLKELAHRLVKHNNLDKHNPTRRMYSSIRVLNRMNYQAHWEAHSDNPRIMFSHCPYKAIVDHHPEMCRLDAYLLQELLDSPVLQAERLVPNEKGLQECVFLINKRSF